MTPQGVLARMRPRDARSMLRGVSQTKLAEKAGLSHVTVLESEKGKPIRLASAYALFNALNTFRIEQGMKPLENVRDIDWNISGED